MMTTQKVQATSYLARDLKFYAFCQKIKQRASGPGECATEIYIYVYENAPEKLSHLSRKSCHKFT